VSVQSPPTTEQSFQWYRWFAHLSPEEKHRVVAKLNDAEALQLKYTWEAWARDKQLEPQGKWTTWMCMAGRGWGKTRVGVEWLRKHAESNKVGRMALIGRTAADVRDVLVEGESGLLAISPPWFRPKYEPSKRRITWPNGCMATTFSADEPDMLRGPQHEKVLMDELAAWQYEDSFDQALFGLRLGENPQACVTTTPRPTKLMKRLIADPTTHVTTGTTYENQDNLAPTFFKQVVGRYAETRLGLQELFAQLLDDNPNALWKRDTMLEAYRVTQFPPLKRVVVGVDPSVHDGSEESLVDENLAEAGIVVAGVGTDGHGYVLADNSLSGSPLAWATEAVAAYHRNKADRIVAEINNGGALVEVNIRTVDTEKRVAYKHVHAARGKHTRAEPVASLYEQGRVHHVGLFGQLEDQLTSWVPGEKSPDRLDALVWCLTELMLGEKNAADHLAFLQQRVAQQQQKRGAA
jgi:phage terminase large subunit-like protein